MVTIFVIVFTRGSLFKKDQVNTHTHKIDFLQGIEAAEKHGLRDPVSIPLP